MSKLYVKSLNGYYLKDEDALHNEDISDNLVTDDPTKVLSANQGKEIKKLIDNTTPDFLMGVSFKANGTQLPSETDIIVSLDGVNFSSFVIPDLYLRDPSIIYNTNNNKFYMSSTPPTQTEYTFSIYESDDLQNWTEHRVAIPNYLNNLKWAPDLYFDNINNKLIVSFSYQYGTETDIDGNTINAFDIILCDTTDFENFTMSNIRVANLIGKENRNHIDSNIIKINDVWYLATKDDHKKIIEIYQSTDLRDFNIICENILNNNDASDNTIYLEGACQYYFNNKYHLLADSYSHLHTIINSNSNDYQNFDFGVTNLNSFRHCSLIPITDINAKKIILNLPDFYFSTSEKLTQSPIYQTAIYIPRDFSGELTAIPNSIIMIEGNSTITNLRNPFNCEYQKFAFITNPSEKLTITKIEDLTKNIELINTTYNNGKVHKINLNNNSNLYPNENFEVLTAYNKATIENLITDLDSRFTINDAIGYMSGNVFQLYIELKLNEAINTQVAPMFRLIPLSPRAKVKIANSQSANISMFNNGAVVGTINMSQNAILEMSMTYICK